MFLSSCSTDWPASLAARRRLEAGSVGDSAGSVGDGAGSVGDGAGSVGDGAGSVGDGRSDGGVAAAETAADGGRVSAAGPDDVDRDLADGCRDAVRDVAEVTGVTRGRMSAANFGRARGAPLAVLLLQIRPHRLPAAAPPPSPSRRCAHGRAPRRRPP